MKKVLRFLTLAAMLCIPWVTQAQSFTWDFESDNGDWNFANPTSGNSWVIGTAQHNGSGENSLYVSNDNGTTAAYSGSNTVIYAWRDFTITSAGTYDYSFDWQCTGESTWDFMRVYIVPEANFVTLTEQSSSYSSLRQSGAGPTITGGTAIDGGSRLNTARNLGTGWHSQVGTIALSAGTYRFLVIWLNDGYGNYPPSGCIDNIVFDLPSCPKPTGVAAGNVSATDATLTWTAGNEEDWVLQYGTDNTFAAHTEVNVSTTPSQAISGLTAQTTYYVRVMADCGGGEESDWSTTYSFTTPCAAITSFPWTENFESATANTVPDCWDNSASGSSTLSSYPERIWGVYEYSSNKMLRMYNYYVESGSALINTPPITLPASGDYQLTFGYSHRANCGDFTVKVSTDGGASFTDLQSFANNGSNDYTNPGEFTEATISLATYVGQTIVLQFFSTANYSSGAIFIDNIRVGEAPSCLKPTDVTCTATTATSATLSWTAGDLGDDAWQISYKTGTDEWSTPADITTNPYTLTGLTENFTYDVRVRTNCGSGEENKSEWTATVTFTTPCEAITVDGDHPYAVDMRASTIADCWSQTDGTYPWSFSSTNGATFSTSSYSEQTSTKLVSPLFDFGAGDYWMNFTGKLYGYEDNYGYYDDYTATLKVYYRTSPSGAWQELAGQSYSATGETENLNVEEVMLPAGTCQLAFEATTDYSSYYAYTYLYSFAVERVPSCFQPRNLTHSDVTARTATMTWERHPMGTEGAWDLQLATNSTFTEGVQNIVVNTTPSKALTGLTPETHYYVRVKPACDDAGLLWSSIDDFTTLAACLVPTALTVDDITAHTAEISWTGTSASYNIDYRVAAGISPELTEDFEGTASWAHIGSGSAATDNTASCVHGGTKSLKFSGTTADNVIVLPATSDELNTMVISFWSLAENSSYSGNFDVGYVTDAADATTFTAVGTYAASAHTSYVHVENVDLSGAPVGARAAFRHRSASSSWYWWIDDVVIGTPVTAGDWQHATSTTETKQLSGLLASTPYEVKVQGDCSASGDGLSTWATMFFTTDIPCATPTALAAPVSGVKARQVDLTWTSYAEDWQLDVYDQTRGESFGFFDVNIGDVVQEGNNMTYTLDGLEPETEYIVRLRSNCEASYTGDGQSEWTALLNVTTLEDCSTPTGVTASDITNNSATISWTGDSEFTLKYRVAAGIDPLLTEGFESGIGAWSLVNCHANTNIISGANHSGSNGFRFYYSSNPPQYLVSPELTGVIEGTKLEFYYKNYSSSYSETFHVGTSTVAAANATEVETNFAFGSEITADDQQWHLYSATIPEGTKYICIKYTSDNQFYLYIDDILIGTPTAAGAWTEVNAGTATNYVIPTTPGLAAETKYEVQVEALCGDPHPVSDAYFFTTLTGITKNIVADQWYAIASPVHNSGNDETVAGVTNLIPAAPVEYDLLRYNESAGRWESQKAGVAPFTTLERGRGYIYRRSANATLTFVGQRNTGAVSRSITHSCGDVNIKGFNLVGNPYDAAYAPTRAFYTLQPSGMWAVHTASPSNKVAVGEGFFIYDNDNNSYDFTQPSGAKSAPRSNAAAIAFTVSNDDYSDVAYVCFADGEGMPKIAHLNSEAPALSIPQGDRRYAIANLDENTESIPLHFSGFGEYTFSLSDNSLGLGYLHLVDRETGADVDMLRQSGYTFNANGNESERFVVLLRPTADANSFVRVSDSRLIVEGEGELQVFDVMGRQLGSAQVSGTATFDRSSLGIVNAGVYVMRLDGNSQKIVVK